MADVKDFLNQNTLGINELVQSPFFQSAAAQQREYAFHEALRQYRGAAINLTNKQVDVLIEAIASGRNTYKELQKLVPTMSSPTMCAYLSDEPTAGPDQFPVCNLASVPSPRYFRFDNVPPDFFYLYEFKPDDTFVLSISGKNRLYELQKEQESLALTRRSIASADAAVSWAKVSVAVSVVLFVLGRLLG